MKWIFPICFLLIMLISPNPALASDVGAGMITTVAGAGYIGSSGDGGPATAATFTLPRDVAVDGAGNFYFADYNYNRIRKVDSAGIITTVAGTGFYGYSGDGGAATGAQINGPVGLAVDSQGNLYIADSSNHRIRKVNTGGIITTVAGTGFAGYSGDGGAATSAKLHYPTYIAVDGVGNLYITDTSNYRVRKVDVNGKITTVVGNGISGYSGDGGAATNAQLSIPQGIAVDGAGNIYISDQNNHRIRKVDKYGFITTVAGTGAAGFSGDGGAASNAQLNKPNDVAVDYIGNLYIADLSNHRIRKIDKNGVITTVAGTGNGGYSGDGGAAVSAQLNQPTGLAVYGLNDLYIADYNNHRIRLVNLGIPLSPSISPYGGNYNSLKTVTIGNIAYGNTAYYTLNGTMPTQQSQAYSAPFTLDKSATLTVAVYNPITGLWSTPAVTIFSIKPGIGIITTVAGSGIAGFSGDGEVATNAQLKNPAGLAVDRVGNIYIADNQNHRLRRVDSNNVISTVAGNGIGGYSGDGGAAINAQLNNPSGIGVDSWGNIYIADKYNHRIRKINTSGIITTVAGTGVAGYSGDEGAATSAQLYNPSDVAIDGSGNIFIADEYNQRIRKINTNGIITTVVGTGSTGYSGDGGSASNAQLYFPSGVAVDGVGNLYIADSYNNRIRMVDTSGKIKTVAGTGTAGYSGDGEAAINAQLNYPQRVTVDRAGNIYIADSNNSRVRKVDTSGIITTVAGIGINGYSGDGEAATSAKLQIPMGMALNDAGTLYIADYYNYRVRQINLGVSAPSSPIITPIGGSYNAVQTVTIGNISVGDTAYYTLDGTVPTSQSLNYTGPFTVNHSATVTAAVYDPYTGLWSAPATAVFEISLLTIEGQVYLQGIRDYAGKVNLRVIDQNNNAIATGETDYYGHYFIDQDLNGSPLPQGNYLILAAKPVYLTGVSDQFTTIAGTLNEAPAIILPSGDIDSDNKVELADFIRLSNLYWQNFNCNDQDNWSPPEDLNRDNTISIFDLVLLSKNYGKTGYY